MEHTIQTWASARGYQIAWGSPALVAELKGELARRAEHGELEPAFFASELEWLARPEMLPAGTVVVVVALPRPAHRVGFDLAGLGGGRLDALLPPTYLHHRATFESVRQDLERHGLPGARVEHLDGPCKALAARLGLVRYGLNNITYAEGSGSYMQLCAFLTDAALPRCPSPEGPALLPQCDGCDRCRTACPTGAIGTDRVLLRGQHCLTHANESPGEWPAWASGQRHHCLVGCLFCQQTCPVNPRLPVEDTGVCFSARETAALAGWPEPLPSGLEGGVRKKLAWLGQPDLYGVLGRNLAALVRSRSRASAIPAPTGSSPA